MKTWLNKLKCYFGFHNLVKVKGKDPIEQLFVGGYRGWFECVNCERWKFEKCDSYGVKL